MHFWALASPRIFLVSNTWLLAQVVTGASWRKKNAKVLPPWCQTLGQSVVRCSATLQLKPPRMTKMSLPWSRPSQKLSRHGRPMDHSWTRQTNSCASDVVTTGINDLVCWLKNIGDILLVDYSSDCPWLYREFSAFIHNNYLHSHFQIDQQCKYVFISVHDFKLNSTLLYCYHTVWQ